MSRVSIVLPTYNGADYLRDAIDSVVAQTFEDWELIVVNDCSTDETKEIVEYFVQNDSRIKIVNNQENKKLPKSLNVGFKGAEGEYLTWTSDDNIYHPTALECMVDYLDKHVEQVMVCARMNYILESEEFWKKSDLYSNEKMLINNCVGACFLYRRQVLYEIGEYDPDLFLVEDYDYWLRILFHYNNIAFMNKVLYSYRLQSKSLTSTRIDDIKHNRMRLLAKHIDNIVQGLSERKKELCCLYFDFEMEFGKDSEVCVKMRDTIDIFSMIEVKETLELPNLIVYGAGKIGLDFQRKYGDRIVFFADKDQNKVGTMLGDKEIISLKRMQTYSDEYEIVVTAGKEKIYEFLETLAVLGIKECFVYKEAWR